MSFEKNCFNYCHLSKIYDTCKASFWVNYANLVNLFLSVENKNVLDLGCGTGLAVQFLSCKSEQYVGVDLSSEMLAVAREKFPYHLFFEKSILDVEFYREFELVISAFDTINHFINPADWNRVFKIVSKHLSPTGFFIFDVVSVYDHEVNWPNQVNFTESEEWIYFQRSGFDTQSKRALIKNTIFQRRETNWIRLEETIEQISLPTAVILNLLANSGLTCLNILDLETGQNATESSATLFFVCKSSK